MSVALKRVVRVVENIGSTPFIRFSSAGLLMGSAFLSPYMWWAGVLGLALFLHTIPLSYTRAQAFWYGTLTGTMKALLVASWVWSVFPLDWMGDFSETSQLFGIGWMWVTGSIAVGMSYGIFSLVIRPYLAHVYRYLLVPLLFVGAEMAGSLFFSIMQYGPGGTVNVHTSFGYLGYTLAGNDIIGLLARGVGVYGLSFFGAAFALFLARSCDAFFKRNEQNQNKRIVCSIVLIVFLLTCFIPLSLTRTEGIQVATVNTQFENRFDMSALERADRVRMIIDAFSAALKSGSDIIVFPETSYALQVFGAPGNVFRYIETQTKDDVLVVDSDKLPHVDGSSAVRALLYDTKNEEVYTAYKKFLVPSGEYIPYQLSFMMSLFGFKETEEALGEVLEFVPGDDYMYTATSTLPGVLFCSESVSPVQSFRIAHKATLPLIVHPVSHAWLNEPHTFWYQLDLMLKTQARFARTAIVQASNMSPSHAYDRYGNSLQGKSIYETASTSVVVYDL